MCASDKRMRSPGEVQCTSVCGHQRGSSSAPLWANLVLSWELGGKLHRSASTHFLSILIQGFERNVSHRAASAKEQQAGWAGQGDLQAWLPGSGSCLRNSEPEQEGAAPLQAHLLWCLSCSCTWSPPAPLSIHEMLPPYSHIYCHACFAAVLRPHLLLCPFTRQPANEQLGRGVLHHLKAT
jgi:hypothetical protein